MPRHGMTTVLLVIGVLLLATALRFYQLDAQSFWNDEGNSARLSERTISLIIEGTASDIHPPLYYLALRGWRELLGESEFALRALSAFAGVGAVAVVLALGRAVTPHRPVLALTAGLLAAVNGALVYYSQEARMYALLALWAVLSTLLLWRWWRSAASRRRLGLAAAFVLVSTAGLYTHYFYPAVLLWQNLLAVGLLLSSARVRRPLLLTWGAMMVVTLLLYAPWLPIFLRQAGGRPGDAIPLTDFLSGATRFMALGPAGGGAQWPLLVAGVLLLMAVGGVGISLVRRRPAGWLGLGILLGLLLPVLFMLVVGTTRPAYYKFLLAAVPFLCLGLAAALMTGRGRVLVWPLLGLFLVGATLSLQPLYADPAYTRADYRGMAARIAAEDHPNAGVILNAANQWEVFTYYHREGAPVYPLPAGQPDPERIAAELGEIAGRHERLYAVFWGEAERDPQRLVERWLDEHAFKAGDEWVGDVRFVTYAVPQEASTEMQTPAGVRFNPSIELQGYTLTGQTYRPGDIISLTLFWRADVPLETRYKVFLHLLDEQGELVAQRDSEPGGGLVPTTIWPAGETIVDNQGVLLPLEVAPGRYTLHLGLYDLTDPNARLPYVAPDGSSGNAWLLTTIEIEGEGRDADAADFQDLPDFYWIGRR